MKRAVTYIRAGSPDNLTRQPDELLAKFGDTYEITGEYLDTASTTQGVGDLSGLKKLLEDATKGDFDVLLCTDLTRLTRLPFPEVRALLNTTGVRIWTAESGNDGITNPKEAEE
jgi:DNA invertase Pin-like site-specific DNA recombinase